MMPSMILNAVLCLGVVAMVVSPLVWAVRTAHRDVPAGSAKAHLEAGATLARRSRRAARGPAPRPDFGATQPSQAWPTS
jgi:hypothetical protein